MANFGTSSIFNIQLDNLQSRKYHKVSKFDLGVTHPPMIDQKKSEVTKAIEKWITPWPEISFEKILYPKYEGIFQYIAEPSNIPDPIKDYHFISIARNIDYWAKPLFEAKVNGSTNGVGSAS